MKLNASRRNSAERCSPKPHILCRAASKFVRPGERIGLRGEVPTCKGTAGGKHRSIEPAAHGAGIARQIRIAQDIGTLQQRVRVGGNRRLLHIDRLSVLRSTDTAQLPTAGHGVRPAMHAEMSTSPERQIPYVGRNESMWNFRGGITAFQTQVVYVRGPRAA